MNTFVRHTFPMSKSSIKTKTVLTITDMTQSTELPHLKNKSMVIKLLWNISLCICVIPSWDQLKVQQNLLASDYEIYMVFIHLLHLIILVVWQVWHIYINSKMKQPPKYQKMVFSLFAWYLEKPSRNYCIQKTKMSRSINDSFAGGSQRMFTKANLIDKLYADLASLSVV